MQTFFFTGLNTVLHSVRSVCFDLLAYLWCIKKLPDYINYRGVFKNSFKTNISQLQLELQLIFYTKYIPYFLKIGFKTEQGTHFVFFFFCYLHKSEACML